MAELKPIWTDRSFEYPQRTVRLATTFSGIGAIEYAFKRLALKHKIIFAGDIDANCKKTYLANYNIREEQWHSDIYDLDAKPYRGKVDLLVGGAPCQSFSVVGSQKGLDDKRGTLFKEFARIVRECRPKVFLFENVSGLLKHDRGETWRVISSTFENYCGYDVHYELLNARDYGIPQTRERVYCIGFREKTKFSYPAPIPLRYKMYDFLEDTIESDYFVEGENKKILSPFLKHREELIKGTELEQYYDFVFPNSEVADKYYLSEKVSNYVLCAGTKTFKTSIKTDLEIARPLLSTMHKMHRAGIDNYVTYNKTKGVGGLRKLTPRECFRLMGFKDDFKIVVSDGAAYMQAGNSIVVDVLIAILKQLDISKYGVDND